MKPWAIISIIVYVVGIPVMFTTILLRYRKQIRADQVLQMLELGDSPVENPNYRIRCRYQVLYR